MGTELTKRLREQVTDLSQQRIADATGVSQRTASRYLRGDVSPPLEWLMLLCEMFRLDLVYILRGERANKLDAPSPVAKPAESDFVISAVYEPGQSVISREEYESLPPDSRKNYVPIVAVVECGQAVENHAEHPVGWADQFAGLTRPPSDRDAFAVRLHGESMEPNYRDEDLILLGPSLQPVAGEPAVIVLTDNSATFKIWRQDRRAGTLILSAFNPAFKQREIDAAAVRRVLPMIEHMPLMLTKEG